MVRYISFHFRVVKGILPHVSEKKGLRGLEGGGPASPALPRASCCRSDGNMEVFS